MQTAEIKLTNAPIFLIKLPLPEIRFTLLALLDQGPIGDQRQ
jgi:hypothetical protein